MIIHPMKGKQRIAIHFVQKTFKEREGEQYRMVMILFF